MTKEIDEVREALKIATSEDLPHAQHGSLKDTLTWPMAKLLNFFFGLHI